MGRSPYTKFSIDIRMGIDFAGKNKFLEKFDSWCFRCYWWESMKTKTHQKLNVSIPIELHDFLIQKQKVEQSKNPLATIPLSKIVATAIEELKQDEEGKAASPEPAIAPIYRPEDHFAGGSSTRSTGRSRRNG
jgi:hypothetical protein